MKDMRKVSDGYHTFEELYEHRTLLFVNLMLAYPDQSWISRYHDDGSGYEGWFVAGMESDVGQITYHLSEKLWPLLEKAVKELDRSPWDGHTPQDVCDRLREGARKRHQHVLLSSDNKSGRYVVCQTLP